MPLFQYVSENKYMKWMASVLTFTTRTCQRQLTSTKPQTDRVKIHDYNKWRRYASTEGQTSFTTLFASTKEKITCSGLVQPSFLLWAQLRGGLDSVTEIDAKSDQFGFVTKLQGIGNDLFSFRELKGNGQQVSCETNLTLT